MQSKHHGEQLKQEESKNYQKQAQWLQSSTVNF
jgi:hypothetical protein